MSTNLIYVPGLKLDHWPGWLTDLNLEACTEIYILDMINCMVLYYLQQKKVNVLLNAGHRMYS